MTEPKPLVSVIVLTWNGIRFLSGCLGALADQTFRGFEVVLVDNGSDDGSARYVQEEFPWVRVVDLPKNLGFAEGNNRGLAAAQGELIVTLNNDTLAEPDFLAELVVAAERCPDAGMIAALLVNFYDPERIDAAGIAPGADGIGYCLGHGAPVGRPWDEPRDVFGPSAGAALYRREMIDEIGFFDADFFAYGEDFDLAWRGQLGGWRCMTAPRAVVRHVHSATSGTGSPFTIYHIHRNKWYVLLKDWPTRLLVKHLPRILLADLAAFLVALLKGRGGAAGRARWAVLAALPRLLAKRREQAGKKFPIPLERLFARGVLLATLKRKLGMR
ncbi:glycosyl transferase [Geotalea uraniireducens]|uniref:Glycosyl transferase n=1 Tax=Geotalea uraniireducens TaxID=351604 RepID=A0ABM8EII3_9BACT|nr:glycosyltransferase family 2 protein [Geotalea uraniireducens]BDV41763.1 glycosyl transferase [Geotalea uraniireducens]